MSRRKDGVFFPRLPNAPAPLTVRIVRPVLFSDVDPMGIVWFGRYPLFLECGGGTLSNRTGLGYESALAAKLFTPIARMEIDYVQPLRLGEDITVAASMIWTGSAKIAIEYTLSGPDGSVRAYAATTQLFVDAETSQPLWVVPPHIEAFNEKWRSGGFACLQNG